MKKEFKAGRPSKRSAFSFAGKTGVLPPRPQKRREFLRVAAANDKIVTPGFILQRGPQDMSSPGSADLRIGYTASRKVGNAVARNRVKRKLRELARLVLCDQLEPKRDYVLIGRRAAIGRPLERMAQDLIRALEKSGWGPK